MPEVELCPGRWVGDHHPVFVIAELGQNHQVVSVILSFCIKAYSFVIQGRCGRSKKDDRRSSWSWSRLRQTTKVFSQSNLFTTFSLLAKCWNDFILPQEKFNSAALARTYSGPHSWGPTYGEHKQHLVGVVFWHFKKFSFNHTVSYISITKVFISINRMYTHRS